MKQASVKKNWAAANPKSEEKHQFLKRISDNNGFD